MREITFSILRILTDGKIHSGERLSKIVKCSRATISNALKGVDQQGLEISKIRGSGYRWNNPICWLDQAVLLRRLGAESSFFCLNLRDELTSTNTYLLNFLNVSHISNNILQVVAVELQTNGRGSRGRYWITGLGDSLTFSLIWKFEQGASTLSGLSLLVGLVIVRVLKQFHINSIELKWPNDVLHQSGKLAGTLVELRGDILGPTFAVIGIGINFNLAKITSSSIDQPVCDLFQATGRSQDRNNILASLLSELRLSLFRFSRYGFSPFQKEWDSYHVFKGKEVRLTLPDMSSVDGVVDCVNQDGSLNMLTASGRKTFKVGDISICSGN